MITFNTLAAFRPTSKFNCRKAVATNPTMNRNIRFGETDDGGDCFEPTNDRERIAHKYDNQLSDLADTADECEMDNKVYRNQVDRIEEQKAYALRQYDNTHEDD